MAKYRVLDLFAGAGGLSCGFEQNGNFHIDVAIENNEQAQLTYLKNFPNVTMLADITEYQDLQSFKKQYGSFDVIIGGPPCQGFSNANRHNNREINLNNLLVKKYIDFILGLEPEVFVMENVKTIQSSSKLFLLDKDELNDLDCVPFAKDYSITLTGLSQELVQSFWDTENPRNISSTIIDIKTLIKENERKKDIDNEQFLLNLELLLHKDPSLLCILNEDISNYSLPQKGNSFLYEKVNSLSIIYELLLHNTYVELTNDACINTKCIKVIDYIKAKLSNTYDFTTAVYNTAQFGVPQTRERFVMFGAKKNSYSVSKMISKINNPNDYKTVRYAIEDLQEFIPSTNLDDNSSIIRKSKQDKSHQYSCINSKTIHNHCCTNSSPIAISRFKLIKQGENFHNLPQEEQATYADPSRTQNSIYRRLEYDKPAPTVTNVRKSMWIHPTLDRAISIREAARLQSFPDSFIFEGNKDKQYQQIGNAVPPLFAEAIANHVIEILGTKKS